uniref:Chitin-binding type-4 domain-containing protein n=1 Tax=Heliothis virescens TaxID=7102 RepID=A0A2A4JIW2_HELVI
MELRRHRTGGTSFLTFWIFLLQMLGSARRGAEGHGRLMDPPARNSMWRFGFPNPVNYNDNELFCGGYAVQWEQNEGKCGVCGDAHHMPEPRPHEAGGMYGKGIVTRHYSVGQEIEVEVELTANHLGTFVMKLCPNNNPKQEASQECFDRFPLYVSETREDRFLIPLDTAKKEIFRYRVRLPPYITCTQCVLQWTYYTGNMWGVCANGTEAVGCGRSETFRNCADVSVVTSTGGLPPAFAGDLRRDYPFLLYYRDYNMPRNVYPLVVRDQVCVPSKAFRKLPGMLSWCQTNCLRYPPNCPEELCTCPQVCEAIGELEGREGADVYCMDQCIVYPPHCPANRCSCY